jgi:aryl-alcohol dehydrogenase-like predicted oxidoreductase
MKNLRIAETELEVSALCYGMGGFGTAVKGEEAQRLYDTFRQAGGNFFDTAHCYAAWVEGGLGASERCLGECIRRGGDELRVVIATKGGHPAFLPGYPRPDRYLSPEVIASDISDSLERLGARRIDIYILHRDDTRLPVGEIIGTLNAEVARGRIRYLGASNWSVARIAEANRYAAAHRLRGFVISEPQWSLAHANAEPPTSDPAMRYLVDPDIAWHAASKLPVMAYSSTACGYFATGGQAAAATFDNPVSRARLARAQELALLRGCSVNQVALAWLMHQDFPAIPILGTTKMEHLQDAQGAAKVELSPEQVRWLREG